MNCLVGTTFILCILDGCLCLAVRSCTSCFRYYHPFVVHSGMNNVTSLQKLNYFLKFQSYMQLSELFLPLVGNLRVKHQNVAQNRIFFVRISEWRI